MDISEILISFASKKREEAKRQAKAEVDRVRQTIRKTVATNLAADKKQLAAAKKRAAGNSAKVSECEKTVAVLLKKAKALIRRLEETERSARSKWSEKQKWISEQKSAAKKKHEIELVKIDKRFVKHIQQAEAETATMAATFREEQMKFLTHWAQKVL